MIDKPYVRWLRAVVIGLLLILMAFMLPSGSVRAGETVYDPLPMSDVGGPEPDPSCYAETTYSDPTLQIELFYGSTEATKYITAHIQIADPTQLRSTAASGFKSLETYVATTIAKRVNAVLAINGDFYNHAQRIGYIVRQGKRYRNAPTGQDLLMIDSEGNFRGMYGPDNREVIDAYMNALPEGVEIWNTFSFGPILVDNGEVVFSEDMPYSAIGPDKKTQRLGIGQLGPLEYYVVSTEGPEDADGSGMTVADFARLMAQIAYEFSDSGAILAYNLDGGSSNTVVFNNEKINSADRDKIRPVGDILYFVTLVDSENQ